jgi:phage gpG-like protein
MAAFTFKIDGKGAAAKLNALQAAAANMEPVFAVIGSRIATKIRLCFKLGVDPWGTPWAPLKLRQGQPLRDRNRTGLQRIVTNPDATGVTVGTAAQGKIAGTHQFGATIVPKNPGGRLVFPGPGGRLIFAKKVVIPARPFLPLKKGAQVVTLPPAWSADVVSALKAHFTKAVNKATGQTTGA